MNEKFWYILIAIVLAIFFIVDYKMDKSNSVDEELLSVIKQRGYIVVGVKTDTRPFGYLDKNGKNIGFDIDIAKSIAKEIFHDENKIKFIPVTPSNRLYKLNSKEVDIIVATMTTSQERKSLVNFSKSYFLAGQAILVRTGSFIKSLSDLENKNIGVLYGSTAEKNIRILVSTAKILGYKTYNEAYNALKNGRIVAITSDDTILRNYAITDPTVKLLPKRYTKDFYAIALRKTDDSESLLKLINVNITNMMSDGSLLKLKRKWQLN